METKFNKDSELECFLPPLASEVYNGLKEDIRNSGIKTSIKIWKECNVVYDGYHRLKAAEELGISENNIPFEINSFPDKQSVKKEMVKLQSHKRNLGDSKESVEHRNKIIAGLYMDGMMSKRKKTNLILELAGLFGLSDNAIRKILRSRREKNRNTPKQKKEVSEPSPKINSKSGAGTSENTLSSFADSGSIEEKKAVNLAINFLTDRGYIVTIHDSNIDERSAGEFKVTFTDDDAILQLKPNYVIISIADVPSFRDGIIAEYLEHPKETTTATVVVPKEPALPPNLLKMRDWNLNDIQKSKLMNDLISLMPDKFTTEDYLKHSSLFTSLTKENVIMFLDNSNDCFFSPKRDGVYVKT